MEAHTASVAVGSYIEKSKMTPVSAVNASKSRD